VQRLRRPPQSQSCHHLYVIRTRRRRALRDYLARQGIETGVHYAAALHRQPAFRWLGYPKGAFPAAERAAREVCSLPLHPWLTEQEVDRITAAIARFFERG